MVFMRISIAVLRHHLLSNAVHYAKPHTNPFVLHNRLVVRIQEGQVLVRT
jgi:hypothetical protein